MLGYVTALLQKSIVTKNTSKIPPPTAKTGKSCSSPSLVPRQKIQKGKLEAWNKKVPPLTNSRDTYKEAFFGEYRHLLTTPSLVSSKIPPQPVLGRIYCPVSKGREKHKHSLRISLLSIWKKCPLASCSGGLGPCSEKREVIST